MKYGLIASAVAVFAFVLMLDGTLVGGEKDKVTIKVVMKKAMAGGLCKKVASGKGDEADVKELVSLFTALSKNEPPKGEADSWKKLTSALVDAAKASKAGEENKALVAAANCAACHKEHKGKK